MKKSYFKRKTPSKRSKPRVEKFNHWKAYGLTKPAKPRFQGLQGVLWYVVSRYIRKSEYQQYNGACVDGCGRIVEDWRDADCGHFRASSRGFCTRFDRRNLGLQTKYCNNPTWSPDSAYGFGRTIDERYGAGTADELTRLSHKVCREWTPNEYDIAIKGYIKLFEELP